MKASELKPAQESYADRQAAWVEANGVKVGTRVRVVRKAEDFEGGWPMQWIGWMDRFIEQELDVVAFDEVGFLLGTGHYVPYFILEPVEPAPQPPLQVREGKWWRFQDQKDADELAVSFIDSALIGCKPHPGMCVEWVNFVGQDGRLGFLRYQGRIIATAAVIRDEWNFSEVICSRVDLIAEVPPPSEEAKPSGSPCPECGGDGYDKGPRLGDGPCVVCNGQGTLVFNVAASGSPDMETPDKVDLEYVFDETGDMRVRRITPEPGQEATASICSAHQSRVEGCPRCDVRLPVEPGREATDKAFHSAEAVSGESKARVTMPDRETFLANALLGALRTWKSDNDRGNSQRPWYVTNEDLDQLEEWIAGLWEMHERQVEHLRRSGIEVIPEQPSKINVPAKPNR